MKLLLAVPLALLACCRGEPSDLDSLSVRGRVFDDLNRDGHFDLDETGIAGITVYLDLDEDGSLDEGEPAARTDQSGNYGLTDLAKGSYQVRQVLPFGFRNEVDANARIVRPDDLDAASPTGSKRAAIIGGADVDAARFPFMVSVGTGISGDFSQFCGGALVSDQFIVTAAHCSEGSAPDEVAIMLGSQEADEGGYVFGVSAITIHPDWSGDISEGYDMALWRLDQRVDLNALGLSTVDLMRPEEAFLSTAGTLSTTIGWGVTDNPSDALQEVHVPITSQDRCAEAYPQVRTFETQICAGAIAGGLDSCQGDSGGPLLVRDPAGERWLHVGVTSWGSGCGLAGKPGIYGRSSGMSEWAHALMLEYSLSYTVNLSKRNAQVNFSNQRTTRTSLGKVDDRWALSNIEMIGSEDDAIDANRSVSFRFFLFGDAAEADFVGAPTEYTCTFDPDGDGPAAPGEFLCETGINRVDFGGYEDGAYLARIDVSSATREGSRSRFVRAGEPPFTETTGTLQFSDGNDPDFGGDFYIDYFEIDGLLPGVVSIIEVDASFSVQLGLYDAGLRGSGGGGTLDIANGRSPDPSMAAVQFVPEAGRSYLIGVSSQGERASGDYGLRVVNSGTAVATEL
ncbi:MAG: trypsin-like serine protease [Myxococcales bacterium]|nr:trypsin-like serine protease [Myxococcales bacterium]